MPSRSNALTRARGTIDACTRAREAPAGVGGSGKSSPPGSRASPRQACPARRASPRAHRSRARARISGRCRARRCLGARVDQVGDGFGLREVELVVEESALGELARRGDAQSGQALLARRIVTLARGLEAARDQQLQHDRATVRLELEDVFAGVRMRRREEDRQTAVDGVAIGREERDVGRVARRERARPRDRLDERRETAARYAHDADRAAPARRDGDDRIRPARQLLQDCPPRACARRYADDAEALVDEVLLGDRQEVVGQPVQHRPAGKTKNITEKTSGMIHIIRA